MTVLTAENPSTIRTSFAAELATKRWNANLRALASTQPQLISVAGDHPSDAQWVIARDDSLSALMADGSWFAGCSVPRRAAEKLLKTLERSPLVSAYLSPAHAEMIHAARQQMGPEPAMIAIVPTVETFRMLLATGEFATEIAEHRLWFVVGDDWVEALRQLLCDHPGLPPAGRFIRTKLTASSITDPMIAAAQDVFSTIAIQRTTELAALRNRAVRSRRPVGRALLIAPSRYRLWDDASEALSAIANEIESSAAREVVRFDSDDPTSSSPLALALAAEACDAVFAANVFRSDAAALVADEIPWFTWCTRPTMPPFEGVGARDKIIVSDGTLATAAAQKNWPAEAVLLAQESPRPQRHQQASPPCLAIIADLSAIEIPPSIEDLSSHRLLWEHIDAELENDPFQIGHDPVGYLLRHAEEISISPEELDVHAFVDSLITPRWQRVVVRRLASAGMPLVIYGTGWSGESLLAKYVAGPVVDRHGFEQACGRAAALLHVWPGVTYHPIDKLGQRVVHDHRSWKSLSAAVKAALRPADSNRAIPCSLPTPAVRRLLADSEQWAGSAR